MAVTIWHNPSCGSSKGALDYLRSKGVEPKIYLYAKEKPGRAEIEALLAAMGAKPADILRPKEAKGEALGLYAGASDETILEALAQFPALIQRPIVVTDKGAVLARPKTKIDAIL